MRAQVIEGSKEQVREEVALIQGRVVRAIVFIDEPADAKRNGGENGDAWMAAFEQTLQQAVSIGRDVDDGRESIYRGCGE
jgi:hypothetical protein